MIFLRIQGWQRGALKRPADPDGKTFEYVIDPETNASLPHVLPRHPACLHAYFLTRGGMRKLAKHATPVNDTIDMRVAFLIQQKVLRGYAWNGSLFPSEIRISKRASLSPADRKLASRVDIDTAHFVARRLGRDRGIMFQDSSMGTDVDGAFVVAAKDVGERVSEAEFEAYFRNTDI